MDLPIGYYKFHKNKFINYQLNRWHSLGYTRKVELEEAGKKIRTFEEYVEVFKDLYKKASNNGRHKNAVMYLRAAEFLLDPNHSEKKSLFKKFIKEFDLAFKDKNYNRHTIPYQDKALNVLHFPQANQDKKGIIVGMGGFDSAIEEFFCIWEGLAEQGFEVYAFEGPGQGSTLRIHDLYFDHDYEKPVGAILDHFNILDASLLGISMGGYWVIRAAAYEPRISKVISMPPVYDWLEMTHSFNRWLVKILLKMPKIMNAMVKMKMVVPVLKHSVLHAMFVVNGKKPMDAVKWMLGMNKDHLHSEKIIQDVLLLGGENDAFQPPILIRKQKKALINANSVTTRIFTKDENADQHCQIGNLNLPIQEIGNWLEKIKNGNE